MPPVPEDYVTTGVYKIRNMVNGKVYVGSATKSLYRRWKQHKDKLTAGSHYNKHLQAAWNFYGPDKFVFSVIERCAPDICLEREQHWIDHFKAYDREIGYNVQPTAGSNLGVIWPEEVRTKMSESAKKRLERPAELKRLLDMVEKNAKDPEVRRKITESRAGWKPSPEAIEKLRQFNIGRKQPPEQIAKRLATMKANGYKMSDEQRAGISARQIGKKTSEETKIKMSAAHKERMKDPANLEKMRKTVVKRWEDPEARARASEKQKAAWADPEKRAARCASMKGRIAADEAVKNMQSSWDDPVKREKRLAKVAATRRKNKLLLTRKA